LRRAAEREGTAAIFSCGLCGLFEAENLSETERLLECLRCMALWLEVFPELESQDPTDHRGLNDSLNLPAFYMAAEAAQSTARISPAVATC